MTTLDARRLTAPLIDAGFFGAGPVFGHPILQVIVDLDEPFDLDDLTAAAARTAEVLPELRCRYRPRWWRDRWVPDGEQWRPPVEQRDAPEGIEAATRSLLTDEIDPVTSPPWRVIQLVRAGECRLVVSVLHMLVDAAGALAVVRELCAQIAGQDGPGPSRPRRGLLQLVAAIGPRGWPALAWETLGAARVFVHILRMAGHQLGGDGAAGTAATQTFGGVTVAVDEGSPFRERCRALGCTVNDGLVATLALLLDRISGPGLLGILFTVDMRRLLRDEQPRLANLSGMEDVVLPRTMAGSFEQAATAVHRRTVRRKARFPGLPTLVFNFTLMAVVPHAALRLVVRLWARWAAALVNRGLLVTNIGPLDRHLAPLGTRVRHATIIGPWVHSMRTPIMTATSFRDRLSLYVAGFEGRGDAELITGHLVEILPGAEIH